MANLGKWNAPTLTTVLSTGLNTLGIGAMSAASSTIANHTNLDKYVDIEVVLPAPVTTFLAGAFVALYILESVDTTNFPAQSAADMRQATSQLLVAIPVPNSTAAQRIVVRNVLLPVGDFQIMLDNQTGVALNAAGNTVKFYTYDDNLNG